MPNHLEISNGKEKNQKEPTVYFTGGVSGLLQS